MTRFVAVYVFTVVGCTAGGTTGPGETGPDDTGDSDNPFADAALSEVVGPASGLDQPYDLAFKPGAPDELWVVNRGDSSLVVITDLGLGTESAAKHIAVDTAAPLLALPSSIEFGAAGQVAMAHDAHEAFGDSPADFMGPTLWSSAAAEFAVPNSLLDRLSNSPLAVGIEHEGGAVYWVFDGLHASLTKYDFGAQNVDDVTDGVVRRYASGAVSRVDGSVSELYYDTASALLYVSDTGNNRIATLDTQTGTDGPDLQPNYDGSQQTGVDGATITTLVDGGSAGMEAPAGMTFTKGLLFVSDNANSHIYAFELDGTLVGSFDTGLPPGSLQGMTSTLDTLYVASSEEDRIVAVGPI